MSEPSTVAYGWGDTQQCPFCEGGLADGGAGFMHHIEQSRVCRAGFESWRDRVADDLRGEWSG